MENTTTIVRESAPMYIECAIVHPESAALKHASTVDRLTKALGGEVFHGSKNPKSGNACFMTRNYRKALAIETLNK
jgi:hypothetical protein